ncbi:uncharacterized protein LOC112506533 isoform X2 [Cynara cardunculus var. scolymus]|nr:uncharacterized protein LOC112506533 isoform X2 [Cynara cardunculus var. scolymus]
MRSQVSLPTYITSPASSFFRSFIIATTPAMDNPFDQNQVYERFLYGYFIDKGFYETAEVFRREAEARAYPLSPSEIDVPNPLLLEWWVINSDFSEWERKNSLDNEGSYYRDEAIMLHQSGLTQSREYALNEQMIEELTLDNSFGVILRENLVPVSHPGNLLTSFPHVNQGGTDNQGLESIVEAFVRSRNASNESQNQGKRKRSRDYEDGNIDIPGTNNSHLETSSQYRDSDYLFEFPSCCIKIAEDWMASSLGQDDDFNLPTYLFEEQNDEEGNFCSKGIAFKLSSSLVEEKQEDPSFIKDDIFELSSLVKGKKNEEGNSSNQDANMYDCSSHEDDGAVSAINLDELHEAPNNDETQGGITGGNSVSETVTSVESCTMSLPPANLGSTDAEVLDSVVQTILRTTEIATIE